jgi:signal transduction histidine kinase
MAGMSRAATFLEAVRFLAHDIDGTLLLCGADGDKQRCRLNPGLPEAIAQAQAIGREVEVVAELESGLRRDMFLLPCTGSAAEALLLDTAVIASFRAQSVENLVNQIAHDVRNHAFTIGLQGEMGLRRASCQPDLKGHFDAVLRQVDTLKSYLDKLLAFGRPVQLSPVAVNPVSLIREQVQRFQFSWSSTASPLMLSVDPHGDIAQVKWDIRAIATALEALLDNAVRSTSKVMPVVVRIRSSNGIVEIEVVDQGPGIAAETLAKLSVPMTVRRAGGAGLGLAIACKLIHAHGGSLVLDTGPSGTCARVTLPREVATG